jgi:hypothetical protein
MSIAPERDTPVAASVSTSTGRCHTKCPLAVVALCYEQPAPIFQRLGGVIRLVVMI